MLYDRSMSNTYGELVKADLPALTEVMVQYIEKANTNSNLVSSRAGYLAENLFNLLDWFKQSELDNVFNAFHGTKSPERFVTIAITGDKGTTNLFGENIFRFDKENGNVFQVENFVRYIAYPSLGEIVSASPLFEYSDKLLKAYSGGRPGYLQISSVIVLLAHVIEKVKKTFVTYGVEATPSNIASYLNFVIGPFGFTMASINSVRNLSTALEYASMEKAFCSYIKKGWSQRFMNVVAQVHRKSPILDEMYIQTLKEVYDSVPYEWFEKFAEGEINNDDN